MKNRLTRSAIVRAAAQITLAEGYEAATIPRIAAEAVVSPRTVSTWFAAKEDIFFSNYPAIAAHLEGHMSSAHGTVVERTRSWLVALGEQGVETDIDEEAERLRARAVDHDPQLRLMLLRATAPVTRVFTKAAAEDLGVSADDLAPRMFGSAATSALIEVHTRLLSGEFRPAADTAAMFAFLAAGLDALR